MDGAQGDLSNDGPAITGELRISGGASGKTRFGTPVDLPTRLAQGLHALRPAAVVRRQPRRRPRQRRDHDHDEPGEVRAPRPDASCRRASSPRSPGGSPASSTCCPRPPARPPSIAGLKVADLPIGSRPGRRSTASIWQDVDSTTLTTAQLAALRGWIASGGRLMIVGGTAGTGRARRLPRRAAALSPDRARRRRSRDVRGAAGLAAQGRHRRPGARRRARPTAGPRRVRRPRDRRRDDVRHGLRDDRGLRPSDRLDRRLEGREHAAVAPPPPGARRHDDRAER